MNPTRFSRPTLTAALLLVGVATVMVGGCSRRRETVSKYATLVEARQHFKTRIVPSAASKDPVEAAPPSLFKTVSYPSQAGELAAYLTLDPGDGKKHPAIVWITGGDSNSIGDVWTPADLDNDQTAGQYRDAGIVMLFPSLRGGNTNPGVKEGFLGEVDDILAARAFLAKQPYVDPQRIYLGGHSTGGTLVLLTAECAPASTFRAIFSFGPVSDVRGYGPDAEINPFDVGNDQEVEIRSPGFWLAPIKTPTWIFEGDEQGNIEEMERMRQTNADRNKNLHFVRVKGKNHFSILSDANAKLSAKIVQDAQSVPATQPFTLFEVRHR